MKAIEGYQYALFDLLKIMMSKMGHIENEKTPEFSYCQNAVKMSNGKEFFD